ncbi:MAG: HPr(Ser) kinase/phosphatase [Tissierellia bacterium]|nr:HPr(Ser) kinase/phosphatase [Tissierellia bacterium]
MIYFTLNRLIRDLRFITVHLAEGYEDVKISTNELNRPGLQLCGYYNKFAPDRIQIIGGAEWDYCYHLTSEERYDCLEPIFRSEIPLMIFSRGNLVFQEAIDLAKKYNRTLLSTEAKTSQIINQLINYMDAELAPSTRAHGILLDIFGVGVLLMGESGIGKSETALDLLVNGHKLISDDSVIIKRIDEKLLGVSPAITRHFMEIRGIGIIDVQRLFGVGYVMEEKEVELIIHLVEWDQNNEYDRLGLEDEFENILGVDIPKMSIPVRTGRNTSMVVEVATKNFKQKEMGYNPALALNERIVKNIEYRKSTGL